MNLNSAFPRPKQNVTRPWHKVCHDHVRIHKKICQSDMGRVIAVSLGAPDFGLNFENILLQLWENFVHESCRVLSCLSIATLITLIRHCMWEIWSKHYQHVSRQISQDASKCSNFLVSMYPESPKVFNTKVIENFLSSKTLESFHLNIVWSICGQNTPACR